MPSVLLPRASTRHRIACKALYRSLLSKCPYLILPARLKPGPVHPIVHEIRASFRRNVALTSHRLVVAALQAGYKADTLLHTAIAGSATAHTEIISHLESRSARAQASRALAAKIAPRPPRQKPAPYSNAVPYLQRRALTEAELTGKRIVPYMISANQVPMLRFKKPQSTFLSRVIRQKVQHRQQRLDKQEIMEDLHADVQREQTWDKIVAQTAHSEGVDALAREGGWGESVDILKQVEKGMIAAMLEENRRNIQVAGRMFEIVRRERALALEERQRDEAVKIARRHHRLRSSHEHFCASRPKV